MADKKPKKVIHRTPAGVAIYPYLDKPDTKFKEEGEYRTKLRIPTAEAADMVAQIDAEMEKARALDKLAEAKKKNPKAKIPENCPYKDAVDDNGDETGEVEFTFAAAASGVSKKDNKPWTRTIQLFDAKGQPTKTAVWSGSKLRVAYTMGVYFINAKVGYGVKLYLESAKIIELVQGGKRSAKDYGFDDEEEGYTAAAEADTTGEAQDEGKGEDGADDNDDF